DYAKVRLKAKVAEDFSDLNSESECKGKRKRIQKMLSSSSDESLENIENTKLSSPPKMCKLSIKPNANGTVSSANLGQSRFEETFLKNTPSSSAETMVHQTVSNTAVKSYGNANSIKDNKILVEIKNQNLIRGILVDVLNEIRELKNNKVETTSTSIFVKFLDIQFPIENDEDFHKFEDELGNEGNFNEVANELAKFGGSNPYNFIKRSMSSILNDSVLKNYSWLERKGKKSLENSLTAKALLRSTDEEIHISRRILIGYYRLCTSRNDQDKMRQLLKEVKSVLKVADLSNKIIATLKRLVSDYKARLILSRQNFAKCISSNKTWFDTNITFSVETPVRKKNGRLGGRPTKNFEQCTERTNRRRTETEANLENRCSDNAASFCIPITTTTATPDKYHVMDNDDEETPNEYEESEIEPDSLDERIIAEVAKRPAIYDCRLDKIERSKIKINFLWSEIETILEGAAASGSKAHEYKHYSLWQFLDDTVSNKSTTSNITASLGTEVSSESDHFNTYSMTPVASKKSKFYLIKKYS
ncbi:hypothetical protein NQ314_019380, partial [Rhamnusium bicolor]